MTEQCVIVGAGTYGQVYMQYLSDSYEVIGFADDDTSLHGTSVKGVPVMGSVELCASKLSRTVKVFVPIGNNSVRVRIMEFLTSEGFSLPGYIHPSAEVHSSVRLGNGAYVLPGSCLMPEVDIMDFVMISVGVNIAHHTVASKGCFFSQGSNIGASIRLGENAYFGIASTVMTGVSSIGRNVVVGAGAVVINDVGDNAVVAGNPARILRHIVV